VRFDTASDEYTVFRGPCDATEKVLVEGPMETSSPAVHLVSPSFLSSGGSRPGVSFTARGTAWPGEVRVTRDGSSKIYTLKVEGLTGRVSLS
jgi:hypothetical protein